MLPTQNLLAEDAVLSQTETEASEALRAAAQALLEQAQPQLNFEQGEVTMFVLDVPPDVPPQYAPIVIAQASQAQQGNTSTDRTIGICQLIENPPNPPLTAVNAMSPVVAVWGYFQKQEHRTLDYKDAKVSVLQGPEHGELRLYESTQSARYFPASPDYHGPDRATLLVEIGGLKVKVMYFFNVVEPPVTDEEENRLCPTSYWKISLNPDDPNANLITFQSPPPWTSYLAQTVKANLTFADLAGDALGQTTANTITLDTTAAGHGWFLDTTPWENDEFVATSNPNEWVARPGSEASGKMDLLTVLLHEYGHVLGLDHSADARSLMSEDLKPG